MELTPFSQKTIKLIKHGTQICGKFDTSHLERLTNLGLGHYHSQWSCWTFPLNGFIAHRLISEFSLEIEHLDEDVKELALSFSKSQDVKNANNLEDIPGLKRSAWMHQRQAYHFGLPMSGLMLAMGMGTGKTLTAIGLIENRDNETVLIACPKSVIDVWPMEFERNTNTKYRIFAEKKLANSQRAIKAKNQLDLARVKREPFVMVVNYESIWREPLASWIKQQLWAHIIFDECHRIKSAGGKASRFCGTLIKRSKYRIGLTGTPMPHSPLDIYAQYRAIDQNIFGTSNSLFKRRYAEYGGFNGKILLKYLNTEELSAKFHSIAYVVGNDVLDLPSITHSSRYCELEPQAQKAYEQMENDLYFEIEEGEVTATNVLVKLLRLQQIASGYIKADDGQIKNISSSKESLLTDTLEDIDHHEPIVIFGVYATDFESMKKACKATKRTYKELSGRKNELAEWQQGEGDVLMVQIRSGGVGVDLTRAAICIYYNTGYSLGDYEQSIAREHRPGQTRPVRCIHLVTKGTVDEMIRKALEKKSSDIKLVMDAIKEKHQHKGSK